MTAKSMHPVLRSLGLAVGIPTLLASLYYGVLASDVYVSEARFAIRSAKGGGGGGGLAAILASPIVSAGSQDASVVADYAHSHDMLVKVQERLDLRDHYGAPTVDFVARLEASANDEELLEYFVEKVDIMRDSQSDVLTLKARAFDAETSQRLAKLVIELSERLVNAMSVRMETDAVATADAEVERASEQLRDASLQLIGFQSANGSLNPAAESSAMLGLVSGIEQRIVETRAELGEKRAYMREGSPAIVSLKNRLSALERQMSLEKGRLTSADGQQTEMSQILAGYEPLALAQKLAQQRHASALNSLEIARLEAQRKKQYLVTFIEPSLPDSAIEPRRLAGVLTVTVFAFLMYLIGGLLWSALRDHVGR